MTTFLLLPKYYLCLTAPPDPRSRRASINREFLPRAQEPHIYWSRRSAVPRRVVATLLLVCNLCADGVRVCRCLIEQGGRCRPVQFRVEALVWPLSEGIRTRHCHLRHRVSSTVPGDRCESASVIFHSCADNVSRRRESCRVTKLSDQKKRKCQPLRILLTLIST